MQYGFIREQLNESINTKSVVLDKWELLGLKFACGEFSECVESIDLESRLNKTKAGDSFNFTKTDINFLKYWRNLLVNYPNGPQAKYMDDGLKSAICKIFNI